MSNLKCSFCGGLNEGDSVYCVHCGNRLSDGGEASADMVLPPGSFVREYKILRLVGEGGMGQVYEGVHPLTGSRVAIKRMVPGLSADDGMRQRFIEEARVMTLANHPSVIPIHQFFVEGGRFFLVMKFVDGMSLEDLIERSAKEGRPVPIDLAVEIGARVASALDHLHHLEAEQEFLDEGGRTVRRKVKGVIHRDVKPANILLDNEGGVFLTDFGVAKAEGRESLTRAGGMVGTYEYMSPEQIQRGNVGPESDQYALAVTIYNLLAGRVPFPQETDGGFDVMEGHVRQEAPPPSRFRADIPRGVQDALLKALAKSPSDRFLDCKLFGVALKNGASDAPATPGRSAGSSGPERFVEREDEGPLVVRRPPYLLYGAIGLVIVAAAVLAVVGLGQKSDRAETPDRVVTVDRPHKAAKGGDKPAKTKEEAAKKEPAARRVATEKAAEERAAEERAAEERAAEEKAAKKTADAAAAVAAAEKRQREAEAAAAAAEAAAKQSQREAEAAEAEAAAKQREREAAAEAEAAARRTRLHDEYCRGKECGDDQFGQSCGTCTGHEICQGGVCLAEIPSGMTRVAGRCFNIGGCGRDNCPETFICVDSFAIDQSVQKDGKKSWFQAQEACSNRGLSLPTEAQWELAAVSGNIYRDSSVEAEWVLDWYRSAAYHSWSRSERNPVVAAQNQADKVPGVWGKYVGRGESSYRECKVFRGWTYKNTCTDWKRCRGFWGPDYARGYGWRCVKEL